VLISPPNFVVPMVATGSLIFLAILGTLGARTGGADVVRPALRVTFWGAFAMALTAGIGALVGKVV
jgi:VIT1/CCC1 family predicted Fe2+/Mn2+ transporter